MNEASLKSLAKLMDKILNKEALKDYFEYILKEATENKDKQNEYKTL